MTKGAPAKLVTDAPFVVLAGRENRGTGCRRPFDRRRAVTG